MVLYYQHVWRQEVSIHDIFPTLSRVYPAQGVI